jgi:hypothetical protein
MSDTATPRLLSPHRRRLYPNGLTGAYISTAKGAVLTQREGLKPGEADTLTWEALVKSGWTPYDGPAKTDDRGWIIPGSDPKIVT